MEEPKNIPETLPESAAVTEEGKKQTLGQLESRKSGWHNAGARVEFNKDGTRRLIQRQVYVPRGKVYPPKPKAADVSGK